VLRISGLVGDSLKSLTSGRRGGAPPIDATTHSPLRRAISSACAS
jgi:hypothetical protein